MAIFSQAGNEPALDALMPTDFCFYCGKALVSPRLIFWQGSDERGLQIWMPPDCAWHLASRLHGDTILSAYDESGDCDA